MIQSIKELHDICEQLSKDNEKLRAQVEVLREALDVKKLVDKFLVWELPQSVSADLCATDSTYIYARSGTNLLTSNEAEQMIKHLLSEALSQAQKIAAGDESGREK